MKKETVIQILKHHFSDLQKYHVKAIFIFGSLARDEATQQSDVDILVEFSKPIGLFEFVRLKKYLEGLLNRQVDLVTQDALKAQLKEQILKEAVRAA